MCKMKEDNMGWDLYKNGISVSFLQSFLTCQEQCRLKYIEGWMPKKVPLSMQFGSLCHKILELHNVEEGTKAYRKEFKKEKDLILPSEYEQLEMAELLAEAIMPAYFEAWGANDKKRKWLVKEHRFSMKVEGVKFKGFLDGVFRDDQGGIWLFESKFMSQIDDDVIQDSITFDLQCMAYLKYLTTRYDPKTIKGVCYNIVRRPGQRRGANESLQKFQARIKNEVSKLSNRDHYFKRWLMHITPEEIDKYWDKVLLPVVRHVIHWWDNGMPSYPNPMSLVTKYGKCDMFDLIVFDRTEGYRKRK